MLNQSRLEPRTSFHWLREASPTLLASSTLVVTCMLLPAPWVKKLCTVPAPRKSITPVTVRALEPTEAEPTAKRPLTAASGAPRTVVAAGGRAESSAKAEG